MKKIKSVLLLVAVVVCLGGAAALLTPAASAKGSTCWQVDCNTCCRTPGGGVICTQRACV
jgi:hypothetical protein